MRNKATITILLRTAALPPSHISHFSNALEIYGLIRENSLNGPQFIKQMVLYDRSVVIILKMANAVFFNNGHAYSEFIRSIWLSCIADLSSLRPK